MKRLLKWIGLTAAVLAGLAVIAALGIYAASELALHKRYPRPQLAAIQPASGPGAVEAGLRVGTRYGCTDCHGKDLRGLLLDDHPAVARVFTPNLTRLVRRYSDADLVRVIRTGVRPDGTSVWVMPSGVFSRLSDDELSKLLAYLRSVPPGGPEQPRTQVGPRGRLKVLLGELQPEAARAVEGPRRLPLDAGPQYAAGRHFAGASCAECHGLDLTGDKQLKSPDLTVAAAYDLPTFKRFLRTGVAAGGRKLPLMSDIAPVRFGQLSGAELEALHAYLRARAERIR